MCDQPFRVVRRILVVAALLAAGAILAAPLPAAVAVFANRSEQTVRFNVQPAQDQAGQYSLAPRKLVPVRIRDRVRVDFASGSRQVRQQVDPNTVLYFTGQSDEVQLQQEAFPHFHGKSWVHADTRGPEPLAAIVPVKIVVDEDEPAVRAVWEPQLRKKVAVISDFVERYCGVRFEVVAVETWRPDTNKTDFSQVAEDFRRKVNPDPAWLAIGWTSRVRIAKGRPLPHVSRQPLFAHLLLPDAQEHFSGSRQLQLLAHELGHFLGAVHSADEDSLMRPNLIDGKSSRGKAANTFDPVNTLAMNLVGDEIRFRQARSTSEISRGTREYLFAIYTEMAARLPGDREAMHFAAMVREPVLPHLRYLGKWVDGTRLTGDTVAPWHDAKSSPQLAGRALFDANRPIRWLLDDTLLVEAPPASWVELVGGDCMPGRVVGSGSGTESPNLRLPAYLEVSPSVSVDWPDGPSRSRIRVTTPWIRRIVWQAMARAYQPQTLFYRDGRQLSFRSVRFAGSAVQLLREEGIQEVSMDEAAELHMPRIDAWESYFDQLAALSPSSTARLVQVETTGGLRATSSADRFQARSRGGPDDANNWYHLVHPAWSLDSFWVHHRSIRVRRYFLPQEVPLSRIEPVASRQESDLGGPWPWRADRNVEGGPLGSGGQPFQWGFGVHATSELEFLLPSFVRAFQTRLGLDQIAGDGGCVRAKIFVGSSPGKPAFESPLIVGSTDSLDSGRLSLDQPASGAKRLTLYVDAARDGRPAAADPFGIRATFDWLEPLVELDLEKVQGEIFRRAPSLIPAWQGWKVTSDRLEGAKLATHWDETDSRNPRFRLLASSPRVPLTLTAKLRVRPDRDRLLVAVNRPPQAPASKIEVRIEGKSAGQFEVPARHSDKAPDPITVSLEEHQGRQIEVEIAQLSPDEKALVQWDAVALVARPAEPAAKAK